MSVIHELKCHEIAEVSGGATAPTPNEAGTAIIGISLMGGPFTMGFGLAIGFGLVFFG